MTTAESRLSRLEAVQEITKIEGSYCRTWDSGDGLGWASLYTDDGIFEIEAVGEDAGRVYTGRAELAEFCTSSRANFRGLHLNAIPEISAEDDSAQAYVHFHFRGVSRTGPPRQIDNYGVYRVTYSRLSGQWLIKRRVERLLGTDQKTAFAGWYGLPD